MSAAAMTEADNTSGLTPEQEDTANLLERVLGRAIANRYVDFCRLASGAFELRVSRPIAGHALRELESTLRDALKVPLEVKAAGAIDPGQLTKARDALAQIGFNATAVDKAVSALQPRDSHATQIEQITSRLGLASDGDVAKAWISLVKTFGQVHKRSFHHSLAVDDDFRRDFQRPFDTVVRAVTLALQRRYSALTRRVDEIAAMPDTERAVTLFEREIPGAMPLQWHFFAQLQSADWLPHLLKRDLVGPPLSESTGGSGGGLREWPAGSYLRRMAEASDPAIRRLVVTAIRNVAPSKHPDVRLGGLEAMAALPAAEAAALANVASEWLDRDATFMAIQAAEKLVKKLATDGEGGAALEIATGLLQVFGDEGEVSSLYAQNMYEYCLPQLAPSLTKACGLDALKLLVGLLHQVIAIDHEKNQDPAFDRTRYDQGAIEDETRGVHSIYDALRMEVRRSAEALIDADMRLVPAIMELFGHYKPKLFRRLEIYVLSKHPAVLPDRATALLLDPELIEASWCTHEYARLARAWFPAMSPANQQAVLALVDAIPGLYVEAWKQRFEEREKRPPTADDERAYYAHVVRDAVWHWRMLLPADRQAAVEAAGDPDAWRNSVLVRGEESPLTGADLAARPAAEIAAFLCTWRSKEEPRRQTVSALALELRNAAAQDPAKYAEAAMDFAEVPAIFVHRLLEGLGEAARNKREFPWAQVLRLLGATFARWQQSVDPASVDEGNDPNWQWACAAGVELLKAGLQRGAEGIPFEHKAAIQELVLELRRRAPQEPEREDFEEQYQRDPYFAAQFTLRGLAVELCVLLLFWLSKEEGAPLAITPRGALDMSPAIREALDAELADQTANGRVPRAVLGRYLCWLFYFGEPWLVASMGSLFPVSDETLRHAAWMGHLLHDRGPQGELLESLQPSYARAIEQLTDDAKDREEQAQKSLGIHLMILYLHGQLDLQAGGMLDRFLRKASPRLRQHVMWWLGVQLKLPRDEFPDAMRAKALAYWDSRLAAGEASQHRDGFKGELGSIGQWCEHHHFEPDWLFDQMLRLLRLGFKASLVYSVVEWLAKISATHSDRAVEVLEALVTNADANHYVGQEQSIRTVLVAGRDRGKPETIARVGEVVSYLASIGQTGYLDVVRPPRAA
jgi:hypothetical protein